MKVYLSITIQSDFADIHLLYSTATLLAVFQQVHHSVLVVNLKLNLFGILSYCKH